MIIVIYINKNDNISYTKKFETDEKAMAWLSYFGYMINIINIRRR